VKKRIPKHAAHPSDAAFEEWRAKNLKYYSPMERPFVESIGRSLFRDGWDQGMEAAQPVEQKRSDPKPMKRLVVTIDYYDEPDGSDVSISTKGRLIEEIFQEGEAAWTNVKGACHQLIHEMGDPGPGRAVTIRSVP
jgi:hypothetical protein